MPQRQSIGVKKVQKTEPGLPNGGLLSAARPALSPCATSPAASHLCGPFRKVPRTVCPSRFDYSNEDSIVNRAGIRGLLNLWNIVLIAFLVWDPLVRYGETGTFIDLTLAKLMFRRVFLLLFLWLQCFLFTFVAFFTYRLFHRGAISRRCLRSIQAGSQLFLIVYSVSICLAAEWTILPSAFAVIVTFISVMKMHSFTESQLEMHDASMLHSQEPARVPASQSATTIGDDSDSSDASNQVSSSRCSSSLTRRKGTPKGPRRDRVPPFDENKAETTALHPDKPVFLGNEEPTLRFFVYYLFCPVLVYETSYPRGPPLRWSYFVRKILEMLATMNALYIISVRYLIPIMRSSTQAPLLLGLAKLVWPMFFCYLLIFYLLFECICNLFAEITRFGDRDFYHDWWNSTTWDEFARKWNRPVHEFLLRHVYHKTRARLNLSKYGAAAMTFIVSGLLHELIMAVCFKTIRFWMFGIMMLQIPLIGFGQLHQGTDIGNCIFWMGMIIGIPLISISYGREYTTDILKAVAPSAAS